MLKSYNDDLHEYRLDTEIIPSVTQVIAPLNDFSAISPDVLKRKADWGSKIHKMCQLICTGELDENSLSDEQNRVKNQFNLFLGTEGRNFDFEGLISEYRMFDTNLKYAGTADIIVPDELVCDIKTRFYDPVKDAMQVIAYFKLWLKNGGDKTKEKQYEFYVLSLFENSYKFQKLDIRQAWSRFRELLSFYWQKKEINQKIKIWKGLK